MPERRAAAIDVCRRLSKAGYRSLLAGGCVRDLILGVDPADYDIATSARPEDVAGLYHKCIGVGAAYGVQIVVLPQGFFEVTTFRKDGPYCDGRHPGYVEFVDEKEDALRRDFTINAMFYDPETEQIIDYTGGQDDIAASIIRTVGDPRQRFAEDHLRMLRAVRFAARLGYTIEPATFQAIRDMAHLIMTTSAERIRDELIKILTEGGARRGFELLDETGLLEQVLPEVAAMKGVEQPPDFHPEGDVFTHTMIMLGLMENPSPTLAVATLLHDVGKPPTQTFEDRIRFNNHDKVGARMGEEICRRLRMSNQDLERIAWLVENHMRVHAIPDMRESRRKRFVRHEAFPELLDLCRMDAQSSHADLSIINWVADYIAQLPPEQLKPPRLLTGEDLKAMGYKPSPLFSEMLTAVEDAQLEGELTTADEARAFVREHWPLA